MGRAGGRAGRRRDHRYGVTAGRPDAGCLTSAMRILVTGGAGFIGSHITERLVVLGHEVRILDNFVTGRRCNVQELLGDVELFEGDIQSYESVHDAARRLRCCPAPGGPTVGHPVRPGSIDQQRDQRDRHIERPARRPLTRACAVSCSASSSSVYGNQSAPPPDARGRRPPARSRPTRPPNLLGRATVAASPEVHGLETVALRYFNVFGPRQDPGSQYAAVIPTSSARSWPAARRRSSATVSSAAISRSSTTSSKPTFSRGMPRVCRDRSSTSPAVSG